MQLKQGFQRGFQNGELRQSMMFHLSLDYQYILPDC